MQSIVKRFFSSRLSDKPGGVETRESYRERLKTHVWAYVAKESFHDISQTKIGKDWWKIPTVRVGFWK